MISQVALLKLLFAVAVLLLTWIAAVIPFKKKVKDGKAYDFPVGESMSCGVFLGAGLLHMLSESSQAFQAAQFDYPFAFLIAGGTFLLFLWLEHVGREFYHQRTCHAAHHGNTCYFVLIALLMMSIHSFLAGAALGLSDEYSVVTLLFVAIIAHKWAEAFAIAVHLNKSEMTQKSRYLLFLLFSVMTPIGILFGSAMMSWLPSHSLCLPIFSALAAGTFLYLGTLHGLEKGVLVKQCCNLRHFSYVIFGFLVMAIVALYV